MKPDKKDSLERRQEIHLVDEYISTHNKSMEDFSEIIRLCSQINKRINKIAKSANMEPKSIKRFLSVVEEYSSLNDTEE